MTGALDPNSAVTLTDVSLTYSGKPNFSHPYFNQPTHDQPSSGHFALRHVNGRFAVGSMTAIVGPNGGGKSSLLNLIAQGGSASLGRVTGTVAFHPELRPRIAWLPQDARPDTSYPVEVRDLLLSGLWGNGGGGGSGLGSGIGRGWFGAVSRDDARRADVMLKRVGLTDRAHSLIGELSTGQMQRLLFARLALRDARLMLLDEPFNAVDAETSALLIDMLRTWHAEGRTLLVVMHDLNLVRAVFPETLRLAQEVLDWGPTERVLGQHAPAEPTDRAVGLPTNPAIQSAQLTLRVAA